MIEILLSERDQVALRQRGLLKETETAVRMGELVLAINPVTQDRRVIDTSNVLLENSKRLLRG